MRYAKIVVLASTLAAVGVSFNAPSARAATVTIKEPGPKSRPASIDVMATAGWWEVGVGAWYGYPIMPEGFVEQWNDAFFIEAGGFLSYNYGWGLYNYTAISPLLGVRYNAYLTPEWTVFATAKAGYVIDITQNKVSVPYWTGTATAYREETFGYSHFTMGGSVGAYWKASDSMSLRLEAGYPFPLQVGLALSL